MFFPTLPSHDPGGLVARPLIAGVTGHAEFDGPDDCYRITLWRSWGVGAAALQPYVMWIGMNPSMAGRDVDDPTVQKEVILTSRLIPHVTAYLKMNVMPYRSTAPKGLLTASVPVWTEANLYTIRRMAQAAQCKLVVCAWGNVPHPSLKPGYTATRQVLADVERARPGLIACLGTNESTGEPRHPLYVPYSSRLIAFDLAGWHA